MRKSYTGVHPRRRSKARKSVKKLRTLAGCLVRDLERKLSASGKPDTEYQEFIELCYRVLSQESKIKNKVYSPHEPSVSCIAKGKSHPKYEFGSKVIVARGSNTGVILGIQSFTGNPRDSKILSPLLCQVKRIVSFFRRSSSPKLHCGQRFSRDKRNRGHKSLFTCFGDRIV